MYEEFFNQNIQKFTKLTKKPEKIINSTNEVSDKIKNLLKETYIFAKSCEKYPSDALPDLIVEDFDVEQIWQQVELKNESLLQSSLENVSKLVAAKDRLWFMTSSQESNENDDDTDENNIEEETHEENGIKHDESETNEKKSEEQQPPRKKCKKNRENKQKKSIVDDDFFKLDEMTKFLKSAERDKPVKKDSDDDDEDSIDLFNSMDEDSGEEETENNPKYDDFFEDSEDDERNYEKSRSDSENDEMDERRDGEESGNDEEVNEMDIEQQKSSLEMREERLKKRIEDFEQNAIQEKPWQLKGEVTADKRPQNSLLEEIVEFDLTTRPAPVVTEETTLRLEDIIKQRIKDKAWDDVERKEKLVETPYEYKKKLLLDQEKSKKSLAQIYEDEYLKQKEALDPEAEEKPEEIPKEHLEIKEMLKSLFSKLDALSNFHFTPKIIAPELRVVNNLPAINMEEVAPVAASDAALLAPEEVQTKQKGELLGRDEMTRTDKKRELRKKKLKQKIHAKEKQKKEQIKSKLGLGNKYSKEKVKKLMDKVTKEKNVDKMDETLGSKSVKSSTAFFTQLQEEVKSQIKSKTSSKKQKQNVNAKKLKL